MGLLAADARAILAAHDGALIRARDSVGRDCILSIGAVLFGYWREAGVNSRPTRSTSMLIS